VVLRPPRTVSALERVVLDVRLLHLVRVPVPGESLGRDDLGPVVGDGQSETTVGAPPVEQYGTRAALAVVAALLRGGVPKSLAQRVEERRAARLDEDPGAVLDAPVDSQYPNQRITAHPSFRMKITLSM
jgi:hypothetical protein